MGRLPVLKAHELVRALQKAGFHEHNQRGSHLQMKHPSRPGKVTIPMHGGDLKAGLLKGVLEQAGLRVDELLELLR
jgi:predicted RNA binding protein YcfA (HicA-like mRNA interferase family)